VRVEAWFAIAAAFSSVPPFLYAAIPVARKPWLPSLVAIRQLPLSGRSGELTGVSR